MDKISKEKRSEIMSRIRGSDTKPELALKPHLELMGFAYQAKIDSIKIDFIHEFHKIAIFVDGCFWHVCPLHGTMPGSNTNYWIPKLRKNIETDHKVNETLIKAGWRVIRIWEHNIKKDSVESVISRIRFISGVNFMLIVI